MNKKFLCTGAFIVLFSGILLLLFLKGAIPIPSSVGLEYTDEIQMDVQSLAYASTAASQCKSQGIDRFKQIRLCHFKSSKWSIYRLFPLKLG